mgnify:FL=1
MTEVTNLMLGVFTDVKTGGLQIMTAAVGLGVVFVGGKWLWGKTRQWLANV